MTAAEPRPLRAVALAGSLRHGSYNKLLLANVVRLAPPSLEITVWDGLRGVPPFDEDVATEQGDPPVVAGLRAAIKAADALIVVTPEYNYGVPGVLKNALDWVSVPPGRSGLEDKVVAILGASPSILGTARAQTQLRALFVFTQSHVVTHPEVFVTQAAKRFDESGLLLDPGATKLIGRLLDNVVHLARRLGGPRE